MRTHVHLYDDPSAKTLHIDEIAKYLRKKLPGLKIDKRGKFITHHLKNDVNGLAMELARARVRELDSPDTSFEPLYGEVEYERRALKDPYCESGSVLYDGFKLHLLIQKLVPKREFGHFHILFTNRLFGTWDESDHRYHARVIICGHPSIISTTGIVEAPAKPKEFYYLKRQYAMLGMQIPLEVLKEKVKGRFIDYDDERLTEVMKGYAMQAISYHLTHEPFCEKKYCRLYNAHWQEEVLDAQLSSPEFCERHEKMLEELRGSYNK
ncbi:MAG: hypothetical protein BME93_00180 [Methanosarcinales archaeon Met12]|nr:MAG: hypothetical protein BME93_00180 [Methanosarcinales archaeon Met12]